MVLTWPGEEGPSSEADGAGAANSASAAETASATGPDEGGPGQQPAADAGNDNADAAAVSARSPAAMAPVKIDWAPGGNRWAEVSIGVLCSGEDTHAMPLALRLRAPGDFPMATRDALVSWRALLTLCTLGQSRPLHAEQTLAEALNGQGTQRARRSGCMLHRIGLDTGM